MLEWLFRNHKERGNEGKKGVHLADLGCQDFDQPGLGAFLLGSNHPKFCSFRKQFEAMACHGRGNFHIRGVLSLIY